jgi:hypothetical protein
LCIGVGRGAPRQLSSAPPSARLGAGLARHGSRWNQAGPRADKPPWVVASALFRHVLMPQIRASAHRDRLHPRPIMSGGAAPRLALGVHGLRLRDASLPTPLRTPKDVMNDEFWASSTPIRALWCCVVAPAVLVDAPAVGEDAHGVLVDAHGVERGVHGVERGVHGVGSNVHGVLVDAHGVERDAHGVCEDAHGVLVDVHSVGGDAHGVEREAHGVWAQPICAVVEVWFKQLSRCVVTL